MILYSSRGPVAMASTTPQGDYLLPAINPIDKTIWNVIVRERKIETIRGRGIGAARELAFTVPWALMHPLAVCRGVRDRDEANWLCYSSRPHRGYDHPTGEVFSAQPDEVFLVFVNSERVVYNW